MLGSLFPYLKKTSILPSKPPSDITSSRVNPFWSHSYALNIFSLLHLSHLSYKAKVTQLLRMYEGWVPGLPASRAMPFLLCWGGGLRKSSAYWPIKGSTYVEQLYKNKLILKKRRLYEPMCPCWRQVHIYICECMNKSEKNVKTKIYILLIHSPKEPNETFLHCLIALLTLATTFWPIVT